MSTIDIQNAKQIRDPMEVYCGISARAKNNLAFTVSSDVGVIDNNISEALDSEHWEMRQLTDLAGGGFPLDGTRQWYDDIEASEEFGKLGLRSDIGGTTVITVTSATEFAAITIAVTKGSGTITANGKVYEIRRIVVIPVNAKNIELTIKSDDVGDRVEIASITPGITLSFTNENIVSTRLALRSDLSIDSPTWAVSDIEIRAYWPDDISEAISNVGDDVPIWYYAGYDGDYSETRNFYLSERATMEQNVITLKGEDSSAKLENKSYPARVLHSSSLNGRRLLYFRFCNAITDAGIKLIKKEAAPAKGTGAETKYTAVFREHTSRDIVSHVMNLSHYGVFWPVFVDAGIPSVRWSKPASKWDIYEEDCGNVKREAERNIGKIKSSNSDYGISTKAVRSDKLETLATRNVKAGNFYSHNEEGFYWYLTVTNAVSKIANASRIAWTAAKSTVSKKVDGKKKAVNQCVVKGKKVNISTVAKSITESNKRPGVTLLIDPAVYGKVYQGTTLVYPRHKSLFDRSNITGSFLWKGDPRMMPRDVFTFHRLDGTTEECTLENIVLTHEGGGTTAEITYRKGIV